MVGGVFSLGGVWYTIRMETIIKTKYVSLTDSMKLYVEEKIGNQVEKIIGKRYAPSAILALEVGRSTRHHRKGAVWEAKATIEWDKEVLRAQTTGESFQEAVDFLEEELTREIKNSKGKESAEERRGARRAKKKATIANAAQFSKKKRVREEGI